MDRRGIAFETLAKIGIVVLILVSVTVFFTVGMQRLADQFTDVIPEASDLSGARTRCLTYCTQMNNLLADTSYAASQPYCNRIFYLEEDGDPDDKDHCYDDLVTGGTPCTVNLANGQEVDIDRRACMGGDFGQVGGVVQQ